MGVLDGKVALVTGAARGQGRSHVLRMAAEGADIIATDLCAQIASVPYPMSTAADLAMTAEAVESMGRRVMPRIVDVRDALEMQRTVVEAASELGSLDIVVANAGIATVGATNPDPARAFGDTIDVNLIGTWNTIAAAAPAMREGGRGGAIVLISSTQGLKGVGGDGSPGITAYTAAKHGVVGVMRSCAHWLAQDGIRVNSLHPTGVETPMITNQAVSEWFASTPEAAEATRSLLPVSLLQPEDVSDALLWLVSDQAKYVTGVALPVDAGLAAR
ncbi:mycofactocin-coupled SDR family oxidoreductase [Mycolicibacterium goodii]|uniref:mycofactocin-coupled SDR family oxidoreductase n=1 Tax=Mycolicibacterium goodii TaxID=134601 RepID=UPI001BDD6445|nr:mycofactocin-coupled SDR family oxidoreductase [Mycolicibacterium goodii]MBU8813990.1 mycofactocin-coupled SDR family oxidoreductase [Mycolicibacterium goodii]ULN49515.1 mycofactocin-coupled SDR family oxidoreductase [Mycolicibacterium goodii]